LLWFLAAFNPIAVEQPVAFTGPMSQEDCVWVQRHSDGAWCRQLYVPKLIERSEFLKMHSERK